jgi:hypothetical protein
LYICDGFTNFECNFSVDKTKIILQDTEGPIETYDLLDLFSAEDKRFVKKNIYCPTQSHHHT